MFLVGFVGFDATDRAMSDDDRIGTVVLNEPFERDGSIIAINLNAVAGLPLRVGIYSQEESECNFRLVRQIMLRNIVAGGNEVRSYPLIAESLFLVSSSQRFVFQIVLPEWLPFEEGEYIGFTFSNNAVVKYSESSSSNYCRAQVRRFANSQ